MAQETLENGPCINIMGEELGIGPVLSQNVCKVLHECVRGIVVNLPPSTKEKERVRRPMNAFMIYARIVRKAMAKHYPALSYRKLSKALGKIWKVLDYEEKKPFLQEAERLRLLHRKEHPDFQYTSCNKRKPKGNDVTKNEAKCLPNVQERLDLIQCEHLNQQLGNLPEIGCDQKGTFLNRNVVGQSTSSSNTPSNTQVYTLKSKESLFASHSCFHMGSTPTWTAFGGHAENIPSPSVDRTIQACDDQELFSLLDYILNDTSASVQSNTSATPQFSAPNETFQACQGRRKHI